MIFSVAQIVNYYWDDESWLEQHTAIVGAKPDGRPRFRITRQAAAHSYVALLPALHAHIAYTYPFPFSPCASAYGISAKVQSRLDLCPQ